MEIKLYIGLIQSFMIAPLMVLYFNVDQVYSASMPHFTISTKHLSRIRSDIILSGIHDAYRFSILWCHVAASR